MGEEYLQSWLLRVGVEVTEMDKRGLQWGQRRGRWREHSSSAAKAVLLLHLSAATGLLQSEWHSH